jgi:uncharacterized protein (TIGR03437 family)
MLLRYLRTGAILLSVFVLATSTAAGQRDRVSRPGLGGRRVVLIGNRNPNAQEQFDRGPIERSQKIAGMTLQLKPSAEQTAELEQLLADQQDPASPNYHQWLTPEQFADRFGTSLHDFSEVVSWLQSQGFGVDYTARSRTWIAFSGTAGQVQDAFRTEIHGYQINGEMHFANTSDPSIPAELEPVVRLMRGLDNFRMKPRTRPVRFLPRLTDSDGSHYLAPGDLAAIYNVNPLYQKGINGTGQKLVIVGQTNISMRDIEDFRTYFGLPKNDPKLVLVPGLPDPGITEDLGEALLDLETSGGIAPNAAILYVYSDNVETSLGYAIDQNLAPVISMSYGFCEAAVSSNPNSAVQYRSAAQQANAQGITWLAASGDSGAADCEPQQSSPAGVHGPAVDMPGSIPEVTAVGGTEFNEGSGKYWNTNSKGVSALSYIPEKAWNDTAADGGLASGGGGASIFFSKPAWQNGPGIPNDNARDVPDVAFTASWDHDPYLLKMEGEWQPNGGTSAATPLFAGILTLLNQYLAANGKPSGLGNINPTLYHLAQTTTGIFHDVTVGSNIVPCQAGSTKCTTGSYGFSTGPGYDQATGLGSVDVNNLVTQWAGGGSTPAAIATTTIVRANPPSIVAGASTVLTATVRAASGTASPAGQVSFNSGKSALGTANLSGSGGTATATLTLNGSQLAVGVNPISASYGGATTFAPSSGSESVTVTVPTTSSAVVPSIAPNPVYEQAADTDGYAWFYTVRLSEIAGTATTLTGFTIAGTDHTADISAWFGSTTLPAHGTIAAALRSRGVTVPSDRVFTFSGVDANGQRWSQQISVPFLPQQISASMSLSSLPETEVQNSKGDPACPSDHPFYQQLNLQEQNGVEVRLTKFLAAGSDFSSSLGDWFGSVRLAPLGSLQADICWKVSSLPQTLSYEVDGVDTAGNKISAAASVVFQGPGESPGPLSVSKTSLTMASGAAQTATTNFNVSLPPSEKWKVGVFPANQRSSWLVVYPLSGTGPAQINLTASAAALESGVYTATLVLQSVNTIPQFVNVSVKFTIGNSGAAISSVANAASFLPAFAPGMLMSVFGKSLSNSTKVASSAPLPLTMDGVSATVNGVPAPLFYISPSQLNIQVPYQTAAGTAVLGVNNNGLVSSFSFPVKAAGPGIFTGGSGGLTPFSSARQGDSLVMFITGEGDTSPALDTGAAPSNGTPLNMLPAPRQPLTMTVGGMPVTPFFVGIPYGLVGVTQVNFTVPRNVPTGLQPVLVTVGGVSSKAGALSIVPASSAPPNTSSLAHGPLPIAVVTDTPGASSAILPFAVAGPRRSGLQATDAPQSGTRTR